MDKIKIKIANKEYTVQVAKTDEEKVNIDVNSSEYTTEIVLQKGFDNKLIIEASNENLTTSKKAQCSLP